MTDEVRRSDEHRTWHLPGFVQILRWALIGLLVVGACAAVLTSWRDASASDYRDALATGKISEVVIGPSDLLNPALTLSWGPQSQDQALVGWSTGPWPWQRFATDEIGTNQAARLAREEGVVVRPATTNWPVLMMLAVFLTVVATLAYGPQPRRFTKWAAFWWSTLPFGVGLLWLLVREAHLEPDGVLAAGAPAARTTAGHPGGGSSIHGWAVLPRDAAGRDSRPGSVVTYQSHRHE
jgi:hypothetical protein